MREIVEPFKEAGEFGTFMTNGNGDTYRNHPILACFAGDYPEQVLTSGVATGECPVCPTTKKELGEYKHGAPPIFETLSPSSKHLTHSTTILPASFKPARKLASSLLWIHSGRIYHMRISIAQLHLIFCTNSTRES
jgi:hypothetical protein